MFDVFYGGQARGVWDDKTLPILAEKLGASVDDIKAQTAEHDAKMKQSAMLETMMADRIGAQSKMLAVLADSSMLGLVAVAVMLEHMSGQQREIVFARIDALMGEGSAQSLADFMGDIESGEVVTTVQLKTTQSVLDGVSKCSNAAASILRDAAQLAAQEPSEG